MDLSGKCFVAQGTIIKNPFCAIAVITILSFLLTLIVAVYGYAVESLTLEQAVDTAIQNNPGLKAADAQVDTTEAGVLKTVSGFLPKVAVSETWSRTNNPLMVLGTKLNQQIATQTDFTPAIINNPSAITNYNSRLSVTQPIFNGGKEYIGRTQAKLAHEASIQDRERARQETVYGVIKAYYGVLLAKEYYSVASKSLETSQANVKLAEARFRAGAVLQSDLLRAKVQLAEVQDMLTRAENGIQLSIAGLNFAMGVPQHTEYDLSGSFVEQNFSEDVNAVIIEASSKRPDLLSMALNRQNAEKTVSRARADYLPNFNVVGQVDWNSERFAGDDGRSWAVMAVLQWNIFDGLTTRATEKEALAASSRMKLLEEQTRSAAQLQARQAYYSVKASIERIAATATSVQEAEEGLRIVQKRYETGMTPFVDVLGAESALIRARTNALQALYDNNIAHAELKLAKGTL